MEHGLILLCGRGGVIQFWGAKLFSWKRTSLGHFPIYVELLVLLHDDSEPEIPRGPIPPLPPLYFES